MATLGAAFAAAFAAAIAFAQVPPGTGTMVPNSSGGGGISSGGAVTGCGALGILFNNGGVLGCTTNATLTTQGLAVLGIGNTTPTFGMDSANISLASSSFAAGGQIKVVAAGFSQRVDGQYGFAVGNPSGTNDTAISRNAAGVLEVNTGTNGAFGGLKVAALNATLPSATGTNAVCNTPGTSTALSVQVWATGCAASAMRFKDAITEIDRQKAFETVMGLQPVSYFYNKEYDPKDTDKHIGFIAEQANSLTSPVEGYSLVTTEKGGDRLHGFKYNEMTPLLVGAFQQSIARFEQRFAQLKADNDNLRAEIEALKARR